MLIDINKVKVKERIRKDFGDIQELANDIKENGLINPPVVTPEHELIAGERRLRAMKSLGWQQIEVRIMTVQDALHQLKLEISENENRKDFTFSEKMRWAEQLKSEYKKIAEANSASNGFGGTTVGNQTVVGRVDDRVAKEVGIGGRDKLRQAEYIQANADEEMIRNLDDGKLSINSAYTQLKKQKETLERQLADIEDRLVEAQSATIPDDDYEEVAKQRDEANNQCREWYEQSQRDKKEAKALQDKLKAKDQELIDLARRLEKATQKSADTEKEELIKSQTMRVIGKEIDPVKFALDEAQRLQMGVSEFAIGLMTYEISPDVCRRMPPEFKVTIIRQSQEAIERLNKVLTYLKDEENEVCKTA